MNVQTAIGGPERVKLRAGDFLLLKSSGAFAGYSKSELLEGELWGVPAQAENEPESDAEYPIRLRIDDYLRLHESGAFQPYARTELIDGVVYAMNPQFRPHMVVKSELAYRLRRALEEAGSSLFVGIEGSVALSDTDLPQPDIILTTEPRGEGAIPGKSVALLVEVSASTSSFDLNEKVRAYAAAGIPEYWVLDVHAGMIHQMWSPEGETYAEQREVRFGERVKAATVASLGVETEGLA